MDLRGKGLYDEIWEAFTVLLPIHSVGVPGMSVNTVKDIGRVTYDISSKPPATIEWEEEADYCFVRLREPFL